MSQPANTALDAKALRSNGLMLTQNLRLRVRWSDRFLKPFNTMYPSGWPDSDELPPEVAPAWEDETVAQGQLHLLIQRFINRTGTLPAVGDEFSLGVYSDYINSEFQVDRRIVFELEDEPEVLELIYEMGSDDLVADFEHRYQR